MNIRIHIILPLIVILNFNGISQITTFNRNLVFIHDTLNESISGVAELNGRYYVAGYVGQYTNKFSIAEIDLSGSRLWVKYYGDSTLQQFPGENHAIIATTDGNLVVTGESFIWTPPYTTSALLMKVTPEGDTLWSRTLNRNPVPGEFNRGKGLIETSDQGFAVFGDGRLGGVIYKTEPELERESFSYS